MRGGPTGGGGPAVPEEPVHGPLGTGKSPRCREDERRWTPVTSCTITRHAWQRFFSRASQRMRTARETARAAEPAARDRDRDSGSASRCGRSRVLAEAKAHRFIVEAWQNMAECVRTATDPDKQDALALTRYGLDIAVHQVATIYAEHPDYDACWKP